MHRCFLNDTGAFVDEPRFMRLMTPLVSNLSARPPGAVLPSLQIDSSGGDLEAGLQLGDASTADVLGMALVACLRQFAVAGGSDALWKPLNHEVHTKTRAVLASVVFVSL